MFLLKEAADTICGDEARILGTSCQFHRCGHIHGNFVLGCREKEERRSIPECIYYAYAQGYQAKNCRVHCDVTVVMVFLQLMMPLGISYGRPVLSWEAAFQCWGKFRRELIHQLPKIIVYRTHNTIDSLESFPSETEVS